MRLGLRQLVIRVIGRTAELLAAQAMEHDLPRLNERDHLQKKFDIALGETAAEWDPVAKVNEGRKVALPDDFHRVGGVDSSLTWPHAKPVFFELKAGSALDACAWDAVKLAALLRSGEAGAAVLVAIAPAGLWPEAEPRRPLPGAEFFADGTHTTQELRERYLSSWRRWDLDGQPADGGPGYRPKRAATELRTESAARQRFRTAADGDAGDWEIRASFVSAPMSQDGSEAWLEWVAL